MPSRRRRRRHRHPVRRAASRRRGRVRLADAPPGRQRLRRLRRRRHDGEASTLTDREHLGLVELRMRGRAEDHVDQNGAGSETTRDRHAVELARRRLRAGAWTPVLLGDRPSTTRPKRRGILAQAREPSPQRAASGGSSPDIPSRTQQRHANDPARRPRPDRADRLRRAATARTWHRSRAFTSTPATTTCSLRGLGFSKTGRRSSSPAASSAPAVKQIVDEPETAPSSTPG